MPDRLSALDASFLYLEQPSTPMHVGAVAIFRRPCPGFDYQRLLRVVERRIGQVPRYRQKVRHVPGELARPVWVDDEDFDLSYHVRRSALPTPGTDRALRDLIARLMSRPLDHHRPLWEMYLVEGLESSRVAMLTKTHQALVDGVRAIDIAQLILDFDPERTDPETAAEAGPTWLPRREPGRVRLVRDAAYEVWRRPGTVVDNARAAAGDAVATAGKMAQVVGQVATVLRTATSRAPGSPLNAPVSAQRRFAVARTSLGDYRAVHARHGCAVNDVVLAVISGAMRNWLMARGEPVGGSRAVRAMVPLSVRAEPDDQEALSGFGPSRVASFLVDLPVGEPSAVMRLHQVAHQLRAHSEGGRSVGAETLVRLGGFAPPTLHALGARAASGFSRRIFNLVVTNVPGPQVPLYAAGATMLEMFPVVPLAKGQALAIGVTSYHGGVYYGFNGDRDAMGDVEMLAGMITESLGELTDAVG